MSANETKNMGLFDPQTTGSWGGTTTWNLSHNICQYFGRVLLDFSTTALIAPGDPLPANSYRYDDFLGYAAIETAKVRYGSQDVESLDGEYIKFKYYDEQMPTEKRGAITRLVRGPVATGERRSDLQRGTRCLVELPFFFTRGYRAAMPLINAQDLTVSVTWRSFGQVVDSDDGEVAAAPATTAIVNQRLIVQEIFVLGSEMAAVHDLAATQGVWKVADRQQIHTHVETQSSNVTRDIAITPLSFSLPMTYVQILIRFTTQLDTPFRIRRWQLHGDAIDPDCRLVTEPSLVTSPGDVKTAVPPGVLMYAASWAGRSDLMCLSAPFWLLDFCNVPLSSVDTSSSTQHAGLSNPVYHINVSFPSGVARTLRIDLMGTAKTQYLQQNGELKVVFY